MNGLLDTHTFLWMVFEPDRLGGEAREAVQNIENRLYVSTVTFWEISLKFSLGKIELEKCRPEDLVDVARKLNVEFLNLEPKEAARFHHLPRLPHKDPFDRIIIWQALEHRMALISRDTEFESYKKLGLRVIW